MSPHEDNNDPPTEVSPLLCSVEPDSGLTLQRPLAQTSNGTFDGEDQPTATSEDSLHGQTTNDGATDRQTQHGGLPEVKKKLPIIFPAVAIGVFLAAADQTLVVTSYGRIGSDLHALNRTSWIATAYFLTLTSFQPCYGKLSDIFGRKACLLFGYTIFGLGCLGCGLAQNMVQLVGARAFAGIGGGAMTTVVSILFSDVLTLRERGKWQGYMNIIYAAGSSAGAPLGGIAADHIGWRWAFLVQVPMCVIAFIAVSLALKLPQPEDAGDWRKKLHRVDFPGALLLLGAVAALLVALDRGSNVSWTSAVSYIPLSISIPLFITFVLVEMKWSVEPIAPARVIFNRAIVAPYLCNFFAMAGWLAGLFYIPLYFQAVHHLTATGAGVRVILPAIFGVLGSLSAGFYMQKTGRFYWLTVASYVGTVSGFIVIFLSSGVLIDSIIGIMLGMCISGFGTGNGSTSTLIGLIANASHEDQAVATACSYLFRSLGSVFGVSISATVANQALRQTLAAELPKLGLPKEEATQIADKVRQSLAYVRELEPRVRAVVEGCFARSISAAFALQLALAAGAAVSAFFIREKALGK